MSGPDLAELIFSAEDRRRGHESVASLARNADRMMIFMNGDEEAFYVTDDGVKVPSLRAKLAEIERRYAAAIDRPRRNRPTALQWLALATLVAILSVQVHLLVEWLS